MPSTVTVTIDGRDVSVVEGTALIEAAASIGIRIPHLCYCPGVKATGACRLCVVELEGSRNLVVSCSRQAKEGMVVRTDTPRVEAARRFVTDLILSNHPRECLSCDKNGVCGLQDAAYGLGIQKTSFPMKDPEYPVDDSNPFIVRDYNYCVLCGLCIRICESQSEGILAFMERGMGTKVGTAGDLPLQESGCDFCGSCVSVCPTAALMEKDRRFRGREWAIEHIESVCGYCGCGCQTVLGGAEGRVVRAEPPEPAGFLCSRGRFGFDAYNHPERLRKPLMKRDGALAECEWNEALDFAAARLHEVRESFGSDAVGWIVGPGTTNETALAFRALATETFGTRNVDSSARPYGYATLSRLVESFGDLSAVATADDVEKAGLIVVAGADVTADYPAVGAWISRARERGARLVVVDSRATGITAHADVHLRPRVGAEGLALMRVAKAMLDSGAYDSQFVNDRTADADDLRAHLSGLDTTASEEEVGLTAEEIASLAASLGEAAGRAVFVLPAETDDPALVAGVIDLSLLSGCTERCVVPATITSNVRGHFELLGGETNTTVSDILRSETLRALVVWDDDPLGSYAADRARKSRSAPLDLLIVATPFLSDTANEADLVLPVASVAETSGTRVNMEGRLLRQRALSSAGSVSDFEVLGDLAARLGKALPWSTLEACSDAVEAALADRRGTTKGRTYAFATQPETAAAADTPAERLTLLAGGTRFHFDDGLLTRHSALAALEADTDFCGMNAEDMASLGLAEGSKVAVGSGTTEVEMVVRALDSVPSGMVFAPRWSASAKELFKTDPQTSGRLPRHMPVHIGSASSGTAEGGE